MSKPGVVFLREYVSPGSLSLFDSFFRQTLETGNKHTCDAGFLNNGGISVYMHLDGIAAENNQKCLITAVDISEIRNREEHIIKTNERLKLAFTASNSGSWDWDIENNIFYFSEELRKLFGMDPSEFPSLELWKKILHPDDLLPAEKTLQESLLNKKQYINQYRIVLPDNQIRWIQSVGITTYDGDRPLRLIGLAIDITDRKLIEHQILDFNETLELKVELRTQQLELANEKLLKEIEEHKITETELRKARSEAEKANKAMSDFLTGISHEIRTPMNAIIGYADLLIMKSDDTANNSYLEAIKTNGRTLINLINDILYISKIEAGRMQLELNYIDTPAFFMQFERIFEFKLKEKKLKYTTNLAGNLTSKLYADGALLRQIIINLLGNAITFTDKGEIELNIRAENNKTESDKSDDKNNTDLVIEIKDTGTIAREEWQNDLFDTFSRTHDKTSQNGTVLGLSIARRLIRIMNGTISYNSVEGIGSTFTVTVPGILYQGNNTDIYFDQGPSQYDIPFKKASIVIIHSSAEEYKAIADALSGTALTVLEATTRAEALEVIAKNLPALIISNQCIQGMKCTELLLELHSDERLKSIPVIISCDNKVEGDCETDGIEGIAGYLKKPLRRSELYSLLLKTLPYRTQIDPKNSPETGYREVNSKIIDINGLIASLEGEYHDIWKSFGNRQPIGEIKNFAKSLKSLGAKHCSSSLIEYGEQLEASAETFNIEKILHLIKKYPAMVISLLG
jgi:PAS domain S-box-containing protein